MYSGVSYLHLMTGSPKPCGSDFPFGIPRQASEFQSLKVGFPIRISTDQSFFAAPRGFSQRSTSFIVSQRQGIHRTPLRHLITLITNVHPARRGYLLAARSRAGRLKHRHCQRKTSLLQDRSDGERSGSTDMGCAPVTLILLESRSPRP